MAREAARSRCRQQLELLAGSAADIDTLRLEPVQRLRRAVGFELWGVPLVDPATLIPHRVLVSDVPPWGPRLPQRWVWDQSIREINSRAMLARDRDQVGVLSAATGGIWLAAAAGGSWASQPGWATSCAPRSPTATGAGGRSSSSAPAATRLSTPATHS
jgi:hypothetical protein